MPKAIQRSEMLVTLQRKARMPLRVQLEHGLRLAIQTGKHEEARERLTEAQAIYDRCHDISGGAACLCNLAELALRRQEWDEAMRLSQQSLELFRELEDRPGIAYTLANLAEAAFHRTEYAAAERWLREALSIGAESGMRGLIPALLEIRARIQAACGESRWRIRDTRMRAPTCEPRALNWFGCRWTIAVYV